MELVPNSESMKNNTHEVLGIFLNAIKNYLDDRVILSRYSNLSITALISEQESNAFTRNMLADLCRHLQKILDQYDTKLHLGAVVAADTYNKIDTITTDARNALLDAKRQQKQFVIYSKDEQKANHNNYLSQVIAAPFDQITKRT